MLRRGGRVVSTAGQEGAGLQAPGPPLDTKNTGAGSTVWGHLPHLLLLQAGQSLLGVDATESWPSAPSTAVPITEDPDEFSLVVSRDASNQWGVLNDLALFPE